MSGPDSARKLRRLRTRAQFQALLRQRPVARTAHFALHRLPVQALVLDPTTAALFAPPGASWLGAMAPKRWARRAVTRNAIRRQIYAVGTDALADTGGARLIRMRAALDPRQFPSASSTALKRAVRAELLLLLSREPG